VDHDDAVAEVALGAGREADHTGEVLDQHARIAQLIERLEHALAIGLERIRRGVSTATDRNRVRTGAMDGDERHVHLATLAGDAGIPD
jgi:hypothetical protein